MRNIISEELYAENAYLEPRDIVDAVIYVLGTPEHVQVNITAILIPRARFCMFPRSLWTWIHFPEFLINKYFAFHIRVHKQAYS